MVAFAFLWNKHTAEKWSWVRQLGTTSLLVYWVHLELIYGRWLGAWHSNLGIGQCTVGAVAIIALMVTAVGGADALPAVARVSSAQPGRRRSPRAYPEIDPATYFFCEVLTMMCSARLPSSSCAYRTVTLAFTRSLPSTRVS